MPDKFHELCVNLVTYCHPIFIKECSERLDEVPLSSREAPIRIIIKAFRKGCQESRAVGYIYMPRVKYLQ